MTADRSFQVFSFLFALATIAYFIQIQVPVGIDVGTAACAVALLTLVRPSSFTLFVTLVALQTAAIYRELPDTNTNRLLQFFAGAAILIALTATSLRRRGDALNGPALIAAVRTPLAALLVVVYVWAFVDKLNWGYLDVRHSCAIALAAAMPLVSGMLWSAAVPLIAVTLAIEAVMIPLLTIPRWRIWGVRIGVTYHYVLGIAGFYSFSVTMIALLSLFLSSADLDQLVSAGRRRLHANRRLVGGIVVGALVAAVATILVEDSLRHAILTGWNSADTFRQNINALRLRDADLLFLRAWYFVAFPVVALWIPIGDRDRRREHRPAPGFFADVTRAGAVALIVPAVAFFNGLGPYLGWKTETAFAMYSNLRTEPGFENHLFLRTWPLFPYQSDLVYVRASSAPAIAALASDTVPIPLVALRSMVANEAAAGRRDVAVDYSANGADRHVARADTDAVLGAPRSYVERKLLRFREIRTDVCAH